VCVCVWVLFMSGRGSRVTTKQQQLRSRETEQVIEIVIVTYLSSMYWLTTPVNILAKREREIERGKSIFCLGVKLFGALSY